jgi:Apea-like HEPN
MRGDFPLAENLGRALKDADLPQQEPDGGQMSAGVFAPLLGLQPARVPIQITGGLVIDGMTKPELRETRSWGVAANAWVEPKYAVRYREPCSELGPVDSIEAVTERSGIQKRGVRLVELVIWALRLFKPGSISTPFIVSGPPFQESGHHGFPYEQPQNTVVIYDLSADEASAFASFVRGNLGGLTAVPLDYPLRRFSQAETRENPEDRIVDLMIACESLLLPDREGELSYRMALRFAFTLGKDGDQRRQLFDEMRAAYRVRSWIVHGKTRGMPKLADGREADLVGLTMFARSLADLVRTALRDAVILAQDSRWPPDWDSMILD